MESLTGQKIRGYEIGELIGEGGFGTVYRAFQPTVNRTVAIKVIYSELANEPEFIRSFELEAQTIASLEHPQIVPLYDYWREPDGAYLVMRWLRGGSLREAMTAQSQWSAERVMQLLGQISSALGIAHRYGVVHRDIKPENILLDEDGNAYLSDFGIARIFGQSVDRWETAGSPAYAAPEQLEGKAITPQTDQYSLGIIVYELLTGQHPFTDFTQLTLNSIIEQRVTQPLPLVTLSRPDLPQQIDKVIARATDKNPKDRYPDTVTFAKSFRLALEFKAQQRAESEMFHQDTLKKTPGGTIRTPEGTSLVQKILPTITDEETLTNPYKGLRAFQESDAASFFGRAQLTEHVLNRLAETGPLSRFLAVIGPSGSGKSSLVKAGVLPALRNGKLPESKNWFVTEMIPGAYPLEELEVALLRIGVDKTINIHDQLLRDERGLSRALKLLLPDDSSELLLVIDQFEEIFTLAEADKQISPFLDLLFYALTETRSRFRLIITLRADFYDRPLLYQNFSQLMRQRTEVVVPMASEELEQAIIGPANLMGVSFEASLITAIVAEVKGQLGALPLLQYGLTELFENRQGKMLTLDAYRAVGGILGALARRAEEIYTEFDLVHQDATRQLFMRLVTLGEGTEDTRRRVLLTEVLPLSNPPEVMQEVIDLLARSRLLTFDRDPVTRSPTLEVAHEAILREWSRLRMWLDQSRDDVRTQRTLAALTHDWIQAHHESSFLLRGGRLEQFEQWHQNSKLALAQDERAFLEASIHERQVRQAQEDEQRQHELVLERRETIRRRILIAILLLAAVGAFTLSGFAFNERSEALAARSTSDANAEISRSLAVAANAQAALNSGNPDLALSLAIEANKFSNAPVEVQHMLVDLALAPGTRRLIHAHSTTISELAFSKDGTTVVSAADDGTVMLWDMTSGMPLQSFVGHTRNVSAVAFSSDGQKVITGGENNNIIVWDLKTGRELRRLEAHEAAVRSIVAIPGGNAVISAGDDRRIIIWDIGTGDIIREFESGHTEGIQSAVFSPDGRVLLTASFDRTLITRDFETGEVLHTFQGHRGIVRMAVFSPDGTQILSGGEDSSVILWETKTGNILRTFQGHTRTVHAVDFSPDGRTMISSSADNSIIQWDIQTGNVLRTLRGSSGVAYTVKYSPDGRYALAGHNDGTLRIWELQSQGELWRYSFPNQGLIRVTLASDGETLLTSTGPTDITNLQFGNVGLVQFDVTNQKILGDHHLHLAPITSMNYAISGKAALTSSVDTSLILWDLETGQAIRYFYGHKGFVYSAAFSPDEKLIVSASADGSLILWNAETADIVRRFEGHQKPVTSVIFNPDGDLLLSGDDSGGLILWDVETGDQRRSFTGQAGVIFSLAFTQNGQSALSAALDTTINLWDIQTGNLIRSFKGHTGAVTSVALSPDEKYLASGADDNTVILWDVQTGQIIRSYQGHTGAVTGVAFSTDGSLIVSASLDGTLRGWQVPSPDFWDLIFENVTSQRYVYELTCEERLLYRVQDTCDGS